MRIFGDKALGERLKLEHDTSSFRCWCRPQIFLPCDECETGCWKCTHGLNPVNRARAEQLEKEGVSLLIVHNDIRRH